MLYLAGEADDLVGVGYRYKFLIQIIAAGLLVISGNWLHTLGGFFGIYDIPAWAGIPITIFMLVINRFIKKNGGGPLYIPLEELAKTEPEIAKELEKKKHS